ncbi:MAG: hypothetical protein PWQ85_625 [Geotoga sp.]|jgi:hypothetical protein|nr:hypothetical protein [Geotoga sp.]
MQYKDDIYMKEKNVFFIYICSIIFLYHATQTKL